MRLSASICNGVAVALSGGDSESVFRPFYTSSEWKKLEQEQEDARQLIAQQQQLAKIMRMTNDRGT